MNRRSIFSGIAALFAGGVARGQDNCNQGEVCRTSGVILGTVPNDLVVSVGPTTSKLTYGVPNQCPVCGEVAEPYKRPTEAQAYGPATCMTEGDGSTVFSVCSRPSSTKLTGPMERITRCRKCNAAFFQDAKE